MFCPIRMRSRFANNSFNLEIMLLETFCRRTLRFEVVALTSMRKHKIFTIHDAEKQLPTAFFSDFSDDEIKDSID